MRYGDLKGSQNGDRPPYWIRCTPVETIHEEYLAVFFVVQNFMRIDALILMTCMQVLVFCKFGLKMPIHALFAVFGRF